MTRSKFKKYFLEKPWGKELPFFSPDAPTYIGIGQEAPVEGWDEPLTQVGTYNVQSHIYSQFRWKDLFFCPGINGNQ